MLTVGFQWLSAVTVVQSHEAQVAAAFRPCATYSEPAYARAAPFGSNSFGQPARAMACRTHGFATTYLAYTYLAYLSEPADENSP